MFSALRTRNRLIAHRELFRSDRRARLLIASDLVMRNSALIPLEIYIYLYLESTYHHVFIMYNIALIFRYQP